MAEWVFELRAPGFPALDIAHDLYRMSAYQRGYYRAFLNRLVAQSLNMSDQDIMVMYSPLHHCI